AKAPAATRAGSLRSAPLRSASLRFTCPVVNSPIQLLNIYLHKELNTTKLRDPSASLCSAQGDGTGVTFFYQDGRPITVR
uniref:hypothetical protein n=1 Tax=Niabella sp. TaxID=1962976 RepID=UPI00261CD4A3